MGNNSSNLKNVIFGLMIMILIGGLFYFMMQQLRYRETYVSINKNIKITIELAKNEAEQYQGLSNRKSLCQNCGMLFMWDDYDVRNFAMRNMNFPLDIIFITDQKIVKIESNLSPEGAAPQNNYSSDVPVNYVLEINGGLTDRYGIAVGDEVLVNIPKK
ncbi:MAG: DUF192 domain-containing protein [Candidatus Falkowbacteria bacterium]